MEVHLECQSSYMTSCNLLGLEEIIVILIQLNILQIFQFSNRCHLRIFEPMIIRNLLHNHKRLASIHRLSVYLFWAMIWILEYIANAMLKDERK